jgi:hypothetical protein
VTTHVPVISGSWTMGVRVSGAQGETEGWSKLAWVGPDYFKTLGIPILTGRGVSETDAASSPKVALVNETFVQRWLGGAKPIGARLRTGAEPGYPEATYEIVGVVKDMKYGSLRSEVPPVAFAPATAAVKQRLAEVDPSIRLGTSVLTTRIRERLAREQLLAWLSGFFGAVAAGLVMIGLYGLISYTTVLRRNELGVRLALGAQRRDVLWLILRQGFTLSVLGVAIGVVAALALTRLLGGLLFGLEPTDPATLLATSLLLVAVALLACWLPARRAARANPMDTLRQLVN